MTDFACPLIPAPAQVTLAEALSAFHKEARTGVCDTGNYRCPFYEWGEGPPLIFLPGMADDALSFVMVAALLQRQFRCLTFDHPMGRDDGCNLWQRTHKDYVDDLFALLDHWNVGRGYLFGTSFGSTIALAALHRQPQRFPRAILQGGFARRPLSLAEVTLARVTQHWWGPLKKVPLRHLVLTTAHSKPFDRREPAVWDFFLERSGWMPTAAVASRALIIHQVDLRDKLPTIDVPVLLICGEADPLVKRICERELLEGLPHAFRAEIQGCGHEPVFTHPEVVAELVERFLKSAPRIVPEQMIRTVPSAAAILVPCN